MALHIPLARDADLTSVALDELLRNEQSNSGTHSGTSREEGLKHPRKIAGCDAFAIVRDCQQCSTGGLLNILYGNG